MPTCNIIRKTDTLRLQEYERDPEFPYALAAVTYGRDDDEYGATARQGVINHGTPTVRTVAESWAEYRRVAAILTGPSLY
jgi:hypothetical protein